MKLVTPIAASIVVVAMTFGCATQTTEAPATKKPPQTADLKSTEEAIRAEVEGTMKAEKATEEAIRDKVQATLDAEKPPPTPTKTAKPEPTAPPSPTATEEPTPTEVSKEPTATPVPTQSPPTNTPTPPPQAFGLNEQFNFTHWSMKVTETKNDKAVYLYDDALIAWGTWAIIFLEVTNTGTGTDYISSNDYYLEDSAGRTYESETRAAGRAGWMYTRLSNYDDMNPGNLHPYVMAFDVPQDLGEMWLVFKDGTRVALGPLPPPPEG